MYRFRYINMMKCESECWAEAMKIELRKSVEENVKEQIKMAWSCFKERRDRYSKINKEKFN